MLERITSGGQTGVDEAVLEAAYRAGIPTGGWISQGHKRFGGRGAELAEKYGLQEHESADYPARTRANVRDSDATILLAVDPFSRGSQCARNAARALRKPFHEFRLVLVREGFHRGDLTVYPFDPTDPEAAVEPIEPTAIASLIHSRGYRIVNFAGNRDADLFEPVMAWLWEAFVELLVMEYEG